MRSFLWKCVAIFAGASLVIICSCEKHSVGEFPEAQKEHTDLVKPGAEGEHANESHALPASSATPTPAEFFPEKKNP